MIIRERIAVRLLGLATYALRRDHPATHAIYQLAWMIDPGNTYFNVLDTLKYDAKQAEVFRKVVYSIRDAIPGGHEPDLDGLVIVIQQLVEKNVELKEQRDRWYVKAIERTGLTPNVKVSGAGTASAGLPGSASAGPEKG